MGMIEKEEKTIICDAGPIIHLDELESLDLLKEWATIFPPRLTAGH